MFRGVEDTLSRATETAARAAYHQMPATHADHHHPSTSATAVKTMDTTDSEGQSLMCKDAMRARALGERCRAAKQLVQVVNQYAGHVRQCFCRVAADQPASLCPAAVAGLGPISTTGWWAIVTATMMIHMAPRHMAGGPLLLRPSEGVPSCSAS